MKIIILFALFLGLSSALIFEDGKHHTLNCNCGWVNKETDIITYPWVVAIIKKDDKKFLCAGTILTRYHVITSANCLKSKSIKYTPDEIEVCTETKEGKNCNHDGTKMLVSHISINEDCNSKKSIWNIALVRTRHGMQFGKYLGPACFPKYGILSESIPGTKLMFLGWGGVEKLKVINFIAETPQFCESIFAFTNQERHICAVPDVQQNVFNDEGGSFVRVDSISLMYEVVGVVDNWPSEVTDPLGPSLVTKLTTPIIDWIKDRVSGKPNEKLCYRKKQKGSRYLVK